MMSTCSELMSYSYPNESFFDDCLLDAGHWQKDEILAKCVPPDSLSLVHDEKINNNQNISSNSLHFNCLESFLSSSKMNLTDYKNTSTKESANISKPITSFVYYSDTQNTSLNNAAINSPCTLESVVQPEIKHLTSKFKPISVKKKDVQGKTASCLMNVVPKVVKLDNGQYIVTDMLQRQSDTFHSSLQGLQINTTKQKCNLDSRLNELNEMRKYKREQKLVKNRESAYLSRQRKKEHVKNLEACVTELSLMNEKLLLENGSLKQKIQSLEDENSLLRENYSSNNVKENVKKSTILFGVIFFFMFNIVILPGKKNTHLTTPTEDYLPYQKEFMLPDKFETFHSRSLLHFRNLSLKEQAYYLNLPPKSYNSSHLVKNASSNVDGKFFLKKKSRRKKSKVLSLKEVHDAVDCGKHFNETYIKRMNKALNGLVKGFRMDSVKTKFTKPSLKTKNHSTPTSNSSMTKMEKVFSHNCSNRKFHQRSTQFFRNHRIEKNKKSLWNLTSQEIANIIRKSMDRKADTFYVVTSWKDFLTILPSTNNSNVHRPKVSFLLPNLDPFNNGTYSQINELSMLKIDCNVVDTTLVKLDRKQLLTQLKL